jgi:hypothetical protein
VNIFVIVPVDVEVTLIVNCSARVMLGRRAAKRVEARIVRSLRYRASEEFAFDRNVRGVVV